MTPEELQFQLEGWDFEAKKAGGKSGKGALPDSLWETYSAMANTDGGKIVLGVTENEDGTLTASGVDDIEKVESNLWNMLNNPQKVSVNLLSRSDVERLTVDDKKILVIAVPRADRRKRPVYIKGNLLTGTYKRNFEGDYLCNKEEVRRLVADAEDAPRDGAILPHFGMSDLDMDSLKAFRNLFRSNKPDHPFLTGDDKEMLAQLGGFAKDRESGSEGLTTAGLLMFGKQRSILDRFPYYNLDYRELPSDEEPDSVRWLDRICVDGTWSGNLLEFYQRVFRKLTADLKVPFRLETPDLFRRDETPVHEALREALVNALIHADYTGTIGIRVFKKPDGFEFHNPGGLRIPVEVVWQGGHSDCRNPSLQKMFQMIGAGEKAGSGFPKIRRAWEEQHWRHPHISEDGRLYQTTLKLSIESMMPKEAADYLEAHVRGFRDLSEGQRLILFAAYAKKEVDHRSLAQVVPGHSRDLTLDLQALLRKKILERIGSGKGCSYRLVARPSSNLKDGRGNDDLTMSEKNLENVGIEQQKCRDKSSNRPEEHGKGIEAAKEQKRRDKRTKTSGKILAVCRERSSVTIPELADVLGVTERTIQRNIQKLQAKGLLRRVGARKTGFWKVIE